jgi:hypothetical protein
MFESGVLLECLMPIEVACADIERKVMMDKDFDVVLMTGLPGSGKTTFCRERLFPSHLYISLDQLRTRSAEAELFAFALRRRKSCVIDNTNVSALERARYITSDSKKTSCIYEDTYWGCRVVFKTGLA